MEDQKLDSVSLVGSLGSRRAESAAINASIEKINELFSSSLNAFEQKIHALEQKIAGLEQIVVANPGENPLKKLAPTREVVENNLQDLRSSLMSELKEVFARMNFKE
ncbi:MAG TPA: hypothetical protein VKK79_06045 [Candidatus Lokiarchaeia archaeon]|nr:hypothetical protein [Candidatus Lokiarchaeia archaeon]